MILSSLNQFNEIGINEGKLAVECLNNPPIENLLGT